MNCEDADASTTTVPPGTAPAPRIANGRTSPSTPTPNVRRAPRISPIGRLRMCGSPSKDTVPVDSPAIGGTNRITVPASPQSTAASPSKAPGVTVQSSPEVSTWEPSEVRAAAISDVSRERSARLTTDGPSAIAASTSARLVSDLLPGSETTASTGWAARGAGQRSAGASVTTSSVVGSVHAGGRESRLPPCVVGEAARLPAGVLGDPARPPRDAGLTLGVAAGDDEPADQRDVLEEVQPLLGALGRVVDLPEPVAGQGGRHQRRCEHARRDPGRAPGGEHQARADLHAG